MGALTTEVGTRAKLPPVSGVAYDVGVRLFAYSENFGAAPTGIAPDPRGHPVRGTATRHTTTLAGKWRDLSAVWPTWSQDLTWRTSMLTPGPACHFTRSPGAAIWLSIALNTPVGPGLLWRRSLFEDRPTSVLIKPAQLYARPAVMPGAGLYRPYCRAPWPQFGGLSCSRLAPLAGLKSTGPGAPRPQVLLRAGRVQYSNTAGGSDKSRCVNFILT